MNKLVISQHEMNGLVGKICRELALDSWKPDYIVGLTRGGLIPSVMISQYFNIPMHTLNVSLRDADVGPQPVPAVAALVRPLVALQDDGKHRLNGVAHHR